MEENSQKPKEWMGIANEPNYRFAIACARVLLFKGLAHLPCLFYLALVPLYFALRYLICSALPLPHFCFALPYTA